VESPSLEIFQPRLDKVLCSLLWVTLLGQGLGWVTHRGPCHPRPCCDSVILRSAVWAADGKRCTSAGICIAGLFQQRIGHYVGSIFCSPAPRTFPRQHCPSVHSSELSQAFY